MANQVAFVGVEFTLDLRASDPDRDELFYTFESNLPDLAKRAQIRPFGDGSNAQFVWTPQAADVGLWAIDIRVTDGENQAVETVTLEVKATEGVGAPVFRKPLGTGTTMDLAVKACVDLEVVVEDADSTKVELSQAEPVIEGATLESSGPFSALWTWCPSGDQAEAMDRYSLVLAADDGKNPPTLKNYLVVLRKTPKPGCEGQAPVVTHMSRDQSTRLSLSIEATISDDKGLKGAPLVYTSSTLPAVPLDLGAMQQQPMLQVSGDSKNGRWAAEVPNPVASAPAGTSTKLYYVIVAADNDDTSGDCDHQTVAPATASYAITVTNPGGQGGLALCEACTADGQCGDADDNCLRIGNQSGSFCGASCAGDSDCPADQHCSTTALTSVDGVSARQCVPDSNLCGAPPPPVCQDDDREDNDTRPIAAGKPALPPGTHALVSCPSGLVDDEDWFAVELPAEGRLSATLSGGTTSDLDLVLVDQTGASVAKSESTTSSESLSACLPAGTYFLRVHALGQGRNPYTLTWSKSAGSCALPPVCSDDGNEPDDDRVSATRVDLDPGAYAWTGAICSADEDWYRLELFAGEELHATLGFAQASDDQDLDLQLFQGATNLYPCVESDITGCDDANGSSTDANENLVHKVTTTGLYYLVVRGWDGAANTYDLCIGLSADECKSL